MELVSVVISAGVTIFALGLLIVSLVSYKRFHKRRLLFISVVFIVFLVKGMFFTLSLFYQGIPAIDLVLTGTYSGVFDLVILILLFAATLKR